MYFRQHVPGSISGVEPVERDNVNSKSLFEISIVHRWTTYPDFVRFMINHSDNDWSRLMVEYIDKDVKKFFVIAHLKPQSEVRKLNLHEWNQDEYP